MDRVGDKVHQHLTHEMLIGRNPEGRGQRICTLNREADAALGSLDLQLLDNLLGKSNDVELLHLQTVHIVLQL